VTPTFRSARAAAAGLLPRWNDYVGVGTTWRADLVSGLTVGIIALPLALGFGVASRVGATAGIITAIVAGIVAAVFGGSSVQVSGPTGAMAVVLAPIVTRDGAGAVATVAVMAGVFVIAMGVFGLGRLVHFVPWPVLEGFTVGVAVTIALQQVPLLLGLEKATGSGVLDSTWQAIINPNKSSMAVTLFIGGGVVVFMLLWPRLTHKVPGSIVAVTIATAVTSLFHLSVPLIGALPHGLPAPRFPDFGVAHLGHLLGPALAVATLAAIESLLSARVADTMTGTTCTDDRRELFGQGLANVASGFFGGMPATGAIARSAVNVRTGGRTRVAAIAHAVVILIVILAAAPLVGHIPLAALGAVLMVTAGRMIDRIRVFIVVKSHHTEAFVFALTAALTVLVNLITAIEIGLVVAGVIALQKLASISIASKDDVEHLYEGSTAERELLREHIAVYRLDGALFFASVPTFQRWFESVPRASVVIIRLRGLTMLDSTGADALATMIEELNAKDVTVLVKRAQIDHSRLLSRLGILEATETRGHVFSELATAVDHARRHVLRDAGFGDVGAE
jgi:SulP family sulfate permease